jgi:hypothetical protein
MGEVLSESNYAEWDEFVRQAKGGTIFHTTGYLRCLAEELCIPVMRNAAGKIEAGLVLTLGRFLGTSAVRRPGWVPYNGPLVRPSDKESPTARASEEKDLLVRLLGCCPSLGMYDFILPPEYPDVMPFLWNGFDAAPGYTYQIPPAPVEQWQAEMSKGHRKDLRRAYAAEEELGGRVETADQPEEFFEILLATVAEKAFRFRMNAKAFDVFWRYLRDADAGTLYFFRDGKGRALTATMAVRDGRCAYDLAGGSRPEANSGLGRYVKRLLLERMIVDAHHRGLTFDFEGSTLPGVEQFFRGWGGRCVPKYRLVKIRTPWSYAAWAAHRYWNQHRKKGWFSL